MHADPSKPKDRGTLGARDRFRGRAATRLCMRASNGNARLFSRGAGLRGLALGRVESTDDAPHALTPTQGHALGSSASSLRFTTCHGRHGVRGEPRIPSCHSSLLINCAAASCRGRPGPSSWPAPDQRHRRRRARTRLACPCASSCAHRRAFPLRRCAGPHPHVP